MAAGILWGVFSCLPAGRCRRDWVRSLRWTLRHLGWANVYYNLVVAKLALTCVGVRMDVVFVVFVVIVVDAVCRCLAVVCSLFSVYCVIFGSVCTQNAVHRYYIHPHVNGRLNNVGNHNGARTTTR